MKSVLQFLALASALSISVSAFAAPPTPASVTVEITGQAASPSGAPVDYVGTNIRYNYDINSGGSINDTLPILFCLTAETDTDTSWTSLTYGISWQSGPLPGVTAPAGTVVFTNGSLGTLPNCQTLNISVNTGALSTGNYSALLKIDRSDVSPGSPNKLNVTDDHDHIQVQVAVLESESNVSCFMTDSSGLFLSNCEGAPVTESASDDGRFAIVSNKKGTGVATNPGQFYYNVVLLNPGSEAQTVDVAFERMGLTPQGAQAIHAAVFPPAFSGVTQENFETVNASIPGGSDDGIEGLVIPAGWTLWVDYHLEWDGLGKAVPSYCTANCADANDLGIPVSVGVAITGDVEEQCESGAWGYKKK